MAVRHGAAQGWCSLGPCQSPSRGHRGGCQPRGRLEESEWGEGARQLQSWGAGREERLQQHVARSGRSWLVLAAPCAEVAGAARQEAGELLGSVLHPVPRRDVTTSLRLPSTEAGEMPGQKEQSAIQTGSPWGHEPHKGSSSGPTQLCRTLHACCRGRAWHGPSVPICKGRCHPSAARQRCSPSPTVGAASRAEQAAWGAWPPSPC